MKKCEEGILAGEQTYSMDCTFRLWFYLYF
jgi:hypothetical protein